ncbi:ATPase 4 plasma membrane-type [Zea mays]|uniref:ATPase 4 plasma membrane-type n=1 Tax=Zea mays TaxID=4577 RepID=A0A1D6I7U3_MAIZE|nr:ATPase 4 plasma membrane-type [Zea mays]
MPTVAPIAPTRSPHPPRPQPPRRRHPRPLARCRRRHTAKGACPLLPRSTTSSGKLPSSTTRTPCLAIWTSPSPATRRGSRSRCPRSMSAIPASLRPAGD